MPTLQSHTHCQAAQSSRTSQSLSKSVSFPTHTEDRKESTIAQHCIRAIAGEVMNLRFMHLIKFCVGGQVIALKSATALILDRCAFKFSICIFISIIFSLILVLIPVIGSGMVKRFVCRCSFSRWQSGFQ
jgi:hypothetical protein